MSVALQEKLVRNEISQYLIERTGFLTNNVSKILRGMKHFNWFDIRRKYITSSNVPKILCCCGTKNSDYLFCVKTGIRYGSVKNEHMLRGIALESIGLRLFASQEGRKLVPRHFTQNRYFRHPRYSYLTASIDGLTEDGELVEVKAPKRFRSLTYDHWVQMQSDMAVLDIARGYYVQIVGDDIQVEVVQRDLGWLPGFIKEIATFVSRLNERHFKNMQLSLSYIKKDDEELSQEEIEHRKSFQY